MKPFLLAFFLLLCPCPAYLVFGQSSESTEKLTKLINRYDSLAEGNKLEAMECLATLKRTAKAQKNDSIYLYSQAEMVNLLRQLGFYEEAFRLLYKLKPKLKQRQDTFLYHLLLRYEAELLSSTADSEKAIEVAQRAADFFRQRPARWRGSWHYVVALSKKNLGTDGLKVCAHVALRSMDILDVPA